MLSEPKPPANQEGCSPAEKACRPVSGSTKFFASSLCTAKLIDARCHVEVLRAAAMGLCFGVRDALAAARSAPRPSETAVYGQLVHNELVLVELSQRGFQLTDEVDRQMPSSPTVMITAHGISDRERTRLVSAGKQLIDTTCPLVKRVHAAAQTLARDGFHVLVVGRPAHVEVLGIIGDLESYHVVSCANDVQEYEYAKLGIVCQSTTPPELAQQVHTEVERRNPKALIKFINTICQPTVDRQNALMNLLPFVDAMVIVGGANSNNTQQLVSLCSRNGVPAHHVQSVNDLQTEWFSSSDCRAIGLTAGTSTLDRSIDEVEQRLRVLRPASHRGAIQSTSSWVKYYRRNAIAAREIDWENFRPLDQSEAKAIGRSLAAFQHGENGTGTRFLERSADHAKKINDPHYVEAVRLFIAEEQRHAAELGRFLDMAHLPRASFVATDKVFRKLRGLAGLELIIRVLLTAEVLAKVYYAALRDATSHPVLRQLCTRILKDEVAHVEFQAQRLAIIVRSHNRARRLRIWCHRMFYYGVARWVWWTHRSVFRQANWRSREYWRRVKREWKKTEHAMN